MYSISKAGMEYFNRADPFKKISIGMNILLLSSLLGLTVHKQTQDQSKQDQQALLDKICEYECKMDSLAHVPPITIVKVVAPKKMVTKAKVVKSGLFLDNFRIAGNVDRYLNKTLKNALAAYSGPSAPLITSMRRKWCMSSKHAHGKAIDVNMDQHGHNMLAWLTSFEGTKWLDENQLAFYIEDKPRSKKLEPFIANESYRDLVFENNHATGLHLHIYTMN